jgi:hypothetical protein
LIQQYPLHQTLRGHIQREGGLSGEEFEKNHPKKKMSLLRIDELLNDSGAV